MKIRGIPHEADRIKWANYYYEQFKDYDSGGIFTKGSGKVIGTFQSLRTGKIFTIFDQLKISGWGDRCNRAAQISVCSGYYNLTADAWILKANAAPNLSMPYYQEIYNLGNLNYKTQSTGSTYDTDKIKRQILDGGYIIMYLKGNNAGHTGTSKYRKKMGFFNALGCNFRI